MHSDRIEILDFKPRLARHFKEINQAWLEEYFVVEPYDRIVLDDPYSEIVAHGGIVLFAAVGNEIVGTCSLIKHTEKKYELAKMGVLRDYRGMGIGRCLAVEAISRARRLGAESLVLATSVELEAANALYHSLGFHDVGLEEIGPLPYKRKSIVMRLDLGD